MNTKDKDAILGFFLIVIIPLIFCVGIYVGYALKGHTVNEQWTQWALDNDYAAYNTKTGVLEKKIKPAQKKINKGS